jgi:hypothetical protein
MELLAAHKSVLPPGKHYWLTCPLSLLSQACAARDFASVAPSHSHFTPIDALIAAVERGASAAVARYLATHAETSAAELGACLLQASAFGRAGVVAELIREPASRCPVTPTDAAGATPLHRAADGGHVAVLLLLLDRAHPVDCRDALGRTALLQAVEAGAPEDCLVALLRAGADPRAADDRQRTPVSLAESLFTSAKPAAAGAAVASRRAVAGFARLQRLCALLTTADVLAGAPQLPLPDWHPPALEPGAAAVGQPAGALAAAGAGGSFSSASHRRDGGSSGAGGSSSSSSGGAPIGDLPTLLVMLLAKFKASVDQGIFGSYGDIHGLLAPSAADGTCRAEDVASGCAEMGIPIAPELLRPLMERMTRRRGAESISKDEFVAFWEHLARST